MLFPRRWSRLFTRQLATLLEEGVTPYAALQLIRGQQRGKSGKTILNHALARLREGDTLSRPLRAFPRQFSREYIAALEWAEGTGNSDYLVIALRFLAGDLDRRNPRVRLTLDPDTGSAVWPTLGEVERQSIPSPRKPTHDIRA
jgi:hypothetical protein